MVEDLGANRERERERRGIFGSFDEIDDSLLFFFLILVILFTNCDFFDRGDCGADDSLLFFFLLLVIIFGGNFF